MNILHNKFLKLNNTFGIEALAQYFVAFDTIDKCKDVLASPFVKEGLLVLGGGSNMLFTQNIKGMVLHNTLKGIHIISENDNYVYVKVAAGEVWHGLVLWAVNNNYGGLENLSLIPGYVGAAPMQNIGAYGVEMKDAFEELEALHTSTLEVHTFSKEDCAFGYRESIFKQKLKGQYIITSVTFKLNKAPVFHTQYGAIEQEIEKMGSPELSIQTISQAVINIRSSKLPNPAEIGNAGSFFKNPVVTNETFEEIKKEYPQVVGYKQGDTHTKLAAGWLIETAGWKGFRRGDAGVHINQALVLVNYGQATGKEIFDLSTEIKQSVYKKFGVELEREVNII